MVKRTDVSFDKNRIRINKMGMVENQPLSSVLFWIGLVCVVSLVSCQPESTVSLTPPPITDTPSHRLFTLGSSPTPTLGATETPLPTMEAIPTNIPFPSQSQSYEINGLTLIEYPLISDEVDLSEDCDLKETTLSPVYEKIFNEYPYPVDSYPTIAEVNTIVQPFGYRIEEEAPYRVYKGEEVLLELPWGSPGRISVNQSGTDFVWAIFTDVTGGWLIHGEEITTDWGFGQFFFVMPQYLGDKLIRLENKGLEEPGSLEVLINEEVVYTQPFTGSLVSDCPVDDLKIWEGHWILDMEDQVIMDGDIFSENSGYVEVFEWQFFDGKPLIFFSDGRTQGLAYDGVEMPVRYDEIKHECRSVNDGRGCSLSIEAYGDVTIFFARREGMWYYVELKKAE